MISKKIALLLVIFATSSFLLGKAALFHSDAKPKIVDKVVLGDSTAEDTRTSSDEDRVKKLIDNFEKLQIDRKAKAVMSLFSPTKTQKEAGDYSFIMGLDISDDPNPSPRLYMTAGMQSCVKSYSWGPLKKQNDNWIAHIDEQRCFYDNSTGNKWEKREKMVMEVSKQGSRLMIERYYPEEGDITKFAGFYL